MSMFCSSRWVAKLWRSVCGATHLGSDASSAAMWQTRLSWRVVIGLMRSRPGNIHTGGRALRHQSRTAPIDAATAWQNDPPLSRGQALAAFALLHPKHHALGVNV